MGRFTNNIFFHWLHKPTKKWFFPSVTAKKIDLSTYDVSFYHTRCLQFHALYTLVKKTLGDNFNWRGGPFFVLFRYHAFDIRYLVMVKLTLRTTTLITTVTLLSFTDNFIVFIWKRIYPQRGWFHFM